MSQSRKAWLLEIVYVVVASILILAIRFVQYPVESMWYNVASGCCECIMLMCLVKYNRSVMMSSVLLLLYALFRYTSETDKVFYGLVVMVGLVAVLLALVRVVNKKKSGEIKLDGKILDRLDKVWYCKLEPFKLKLVFRAMIYVVALTVLFETARQMTGENGEVNWLAVILATLPIIWLIAQAAHLEDALMFKFVLLGCEMMALMQYYLANPTELIALYQFTEKLIVMFAIPYSFYIKSVEDDIKLC